MRDFEVIENENLLTEVKPEKRVVTNPIAKKFVQYQNEKIDKFSVKELFKN